MPRKLRQLRADLRRTDFDVDRTVGSHETWEYRYDSSIRVTLAGPDGADAKPYQEKQVREAITRARAKEESP
jgi:hypothetical protein